MSSWLRWSFVAGPALALAAVAPSGCRTAERVGEPTAPGRPPVQLATVEVRSPDGVVVAGSVEAAEAGAEALAAGGNAVDAAVAAAFAIGASEVGAGGLGGVAVALVVLPDGSAFVVEGVPTVPVLVDGEALAKLHAEERPWGYPMVAAPTAPAVFGHLHERFGVLSWSRMLSAAIRCAERGSVVSRLHHKALVAYRDRVAEQSATAALLLGPDAEPLPVGARFTNPMLAATLRRLCALGVDEFYRGDIARAIEDDMIAHGGPVRRFDLRQVRVTTIPVESASYRGWTVLAPPSPAGGTDLLRALEILDALPRKVLRANTADRGHAQVEAVRIALALRGGASEGQRPPWLVGPRRAALPPGEMASRIRFDRALRDDEIGAFGTGLVAGGTTHLVSADRSGMVVSMSISIGLHFGAARAHSGLGFLYNNLLGWVDTARPEAPPFLQPGARMALSMTPAVLRSPDGAVLALGSAGSDRIPSSVVSVVSAVIDRGLELADAVGEARVLWGGPNDRRVYVEIADSHSERAADAFVERGFPEVFRLGFPARPFDLAAFGGTNSLAFEPATGDWVGVADPRRDGAARRPEKQLAPTATATDADASAPGCR